MKGMSNQPRCAVVAACLFHALSAGTADPLALDARCSSVGLGVLGDPNEPGGLDTGGWRIIARHSGASRDPF
jgi:hypothetical protein